MSAQSVQPLQKLICTDGQTDRQKLYSFIYIDLTICKITWNRVQDTVIIFFYPCLKLFKFNIVFKFLRNKTWWPFLYIDYCSPYNDFPVFNESMRARHQFLYASVCACMCAYTCTCLGDIRLLPFLSISILTYDDQNAATKGTI